MRKVILPLIVFPIILFSFSCSGKKSVNIMDTKPVSVRTFDTPPGADPSVPAELGGKGFSGEGWKTNSDYNFIGSKDAVKGGRFIISMNDYPTTLRLIGKESNTEYFVFVTDLLCETLLNLDPVTADYIPRLATHWYISPDNMTFKFRINPDARWADGKPVISDDVVASWNLIVDPGILAPYDNELFGTFEKPVAESKYIVSVKSKKLNWRQFLYFSSELKIFPSHIIGNLTGREFLDKYQFSSAPASGPYILLDNDIKKGQEVTLRRRNDYWAENERFSIGKNNFDEIKIVFVRDESLEFEKFKKGEIDFIGVNKAQWWEEKYNFDEVKRGLIRKLKIYNQSPKAISGIVLNMRKPPFDDINIRKAFSYLYDRKKFNEKLFYSSYFPVTSFFQGLEFANPDNPVTGFNIDSAVALLAKSGWCEKNSEGYLVKNGKVFEVNLPFQKPADRYFTVYQEDLKKAGIKLNLKETDNAAIFKLGNERNFEMLPITWSGIEIPNPESMLTSSTADSLNTINFAGLKDPRIDELCARYNNSFDLNERKMLLREIDKIAVSYYSYVFGWYAPMLRIAFHNKFGFPECVITRTGRTSGVLSLWYIDPVKYSEYINAVNDASKTLKTGETESRYWLEYKNK